MACSSFLQIVLLLNNIVASKLRREKKHKTKTSLYAGKTLIWNSQKPKYPLLISVVSILQNFFFEYWM